MSRRKSRQTILEILFRDEFHSDFSRKNNKKTIRSFLKNENLTKLDDKFILDILKGIKEHKIDIDKIIAKHAKNWKKERISLVDLNIMRIAVFEILFYPDVPDKSALNEALELAKKYGEKKSVSFINGILDQILKNEKANL